MKKSLNRRDQRAVQVGLIAVAAVLLFVYVIAPWSEAWKSVRAEIILLQDKVDQLDTSKSSVAAARQVQLMKKVPAFEVPQKEDKQRLVFRRQFNEQLKKSGLSVSSLKYQKKGRSKSKTGPKRLLLQYKGKGKFTQAMDLLAALNENPYLLSVEEFEMTVGKKKREEMELSLIVSTPVQ